MNFDALKKLLKPVPEAKLAEIVHARLGHSGRETISFADVGIKVKKHRHGATCVASAKKAVAG